MFQRPNTHCCDEDDFPFLVLIGYYAPQGGPDRHAQRTDSDQNPSSGGRHSQLLEIQRQVWEKAAECTEHCEKIRLERKQVAEVYAQKAGQPVRLVLRRGVALLLFRVSCSVLFQVFQIHCANKDLLLGLLDSQPRGKSLSVRNSLDSSEVYD